MPGVPAAAAYQLGHLFDWRTLTHLSLARGVIRPCRMQLPELTKGGVRDSPIGQWMAQINYLLPRSEVRVFYGHDFDAIRYPDFGFPGGWFWSLTPCMMLLLKAVKVYSTVLPVIAGLACIIFCWRFNATVTGSGIFLTFSVCMLAGFCTVGGEHYEDTIFLWPVKKTNLVLRKLLVTTEILFSYRNSYVFAFIKLYRLVKETTCTL